MKIKEKVLGIFVPKISEANLVIFILLLFFLFITERQAVFNMFYEWLTSSSGEMFSSDNIKTTILVSSVLAYTIYGFYFMISSKKTFSDKDKKSTIVLFSVVLGIINIVAWVMYGPNSIGIGKYIFLFEILRSAFSIYLVGAMSEYSDTSPALSRLLISRIEDTQVGKRGLSFLVVLSVALYILFGLYYHSVVSVAFSYFAISFVIDLMYSWRFAKH